MDSTIRAARLAKALQRIKDATEAIAAKHALAPPRTIPGRTPPVEWPTLFAESVADFLDGLLVASAPKLLPFEAEPEPVVKPVHKKGKN